MSYIDQGLKTHYQELVQHAQLLILKLLSFWLLDQRDFPDRPIPLSLQKRPPYSVGGTD